MEKYFERVDRGNNNATCVVFVHGVLGRYRETWGDFPYLLAQDAELNHCDWICWGYPSNLQVPKFSSIPFLGNRMPSLPSVSESLWADLKNPQIGGSYKNLILVGHSMGGLVLMKMIISALTQAEEDVALLDRIRYVVLYATPSDGVQLPNIFKIHPHARSIAANEEFVTELRKEWINRIYTVRPDSPRQSGKRYIPLIAVVGLQDNAVPSDSAASYYSDVVKVQGNHIEVCKPDSRESTAFQALKRAVLSSMKAPEFSDAGAAQTVLSPPANEPDDSDSVKVDAVEEGGSDDSGWAEMEKGNFSAAYRIFEQEFKKGDYGDYGVERLAMFTHMLYLRGWTEGFMRLKQLIIENPDNVEITFYLASAYHRAGQMEKAIEIYKNFRDHTPTIPEKIQRTATLAVWLVEAGKSEEALNELRHGLEQAEDPPEKAAIYKGLGGILLKIRKTEPLFGIACYERALSLQPMDSTLRFHLAYTYSNDLTPAVTFYHYRKCKDDEAALNNAGVEAAKLKLPITSVDYYSQAAEKSNTLSMANIAYNFIEAGFAKQAKETLEQARKNPDYHKNVDLHLGTLQRQRSAEEEKIQELDEKAQGIISWRKLEADAIAQSPVNPPDLIGNYEAADGSTLKITCNDGRTLLGENTTTKETLRFTGHVEGRLLRFNWNTTPLETKIPTGMVGAGLLGLGLATPTAEKGVGSLIIDLNGLVLRGYRTKTDAPLVPIEWGVSRKSSG